MPMLVSPQVPVPCHTPFARVGPLTPADARAHDHRRGLELPLHGGRQRHPLIGLLDGLDGLDVDHPSIEPDNVRERRDLPDDQRVDA